MKPRYQILHNGHRYIIQDTVTEQYHWGFIFEVPCPFSTPVENCMFRWKWQAKWEIRRLEAYNRRKAKQSEIYNSNFKPAL